MMVYDDYLLNLVILMYTAGRKFKTACYKLLAYSFVIKESLRSSNNLISL